MTTISSVSAIEILDSRGRPTVKAYLNLSNGISASASVPSGASTGKAEALELRDGGERFGGWGCQKAVSNINDQINSALKGRKIENQNELDSLLIELDGTANKKNLGANAVLAVSLAFARAMAKQTQMPLFKYFADLVKTDPIYLPRPTINLFSGGKHGGAQVPFQDVLIVPTQTSINSSLDCAFRVYQAAMALCFKKYGSRALTADEGGLAPPFSSIYEMFDDAMMSIENAGLVPGKDVMLAVDVASSGFYQNSRYYLDKDLQLTSIQMIEFLTELKGKYPLVSMEDGLSEDDWKHWPLLKEKLSQDCLTLGDDLLCTNPRRVEKAIGLKAANALLLKVNQIGTITEALEAFQRAREAQWHVTVSARSGETEDDWLADLAVGWQGNQIKIGSITQSERLAKYNRLLEIEHQTGLEVLSWPN